METQRIDLVRGRQRGCSQQQVAAESVLPPLSAVRGRHRVARAGRPYELPEGLRGRLRARLQEGGIRMTTRLVLGCVLLLSASVALAVEIDPGSLRPQEGACGLLFKSQLNARGGSP